MKLIEKIAEARQIRFTIYLFILLGVLMHRAYLGDREGMALCMLVLPLNLYAIVNSPN
jgi:hypothetical protein